MLSPDLQEFVSEAVKLSTLSGYTPRDAVVQAVQGAGLTPRGIQRVCEGTNKTLLEKDKKAAYKNSGGRLWANRWETAKPGEVCEALGIGLDPSEASEVLDAVAGADKMSGAASRSPLSVLDRLAHPQLVEDEVIKVSSADAELDGEFQLIDYDPVERIREMLDMAYKAHDHAKKRVESSALGVVTCEEVVVSRAQDLLRDTDLSEGEVLWAIKTSGIAPDAFDQVMGRLLEVWEIDMDALAGVGDGATIKTSHARLAVRPSLSSETDGTAVPVDPNHPLICATSEFDRAFEDHEINKIALSSMRQRCLAWSEEAAEVLGR